LDKTVDTQWLSPRQVLFLAPTTSDLRPLVGQALRLPDYVLSTVDDLDEAARVVAHSKIEVLLEPEAGKTRRAATIGALRATDPDVQIIVLVARANLVATTIALQGDGDSTFDVLGVPFIAPELVRSVERARELRYLRRSEERSLRAEARMSAVVRGVPHAVVSLDDKGTVHDWNPGACTIFGWSTAEAVGRSFWDIALPSRHRDLRSLLQAGSDTAPTRREIAGRRRDGSEFPAVLSLAPVPVTGRAMYCAIVEDVTDARRLEIELRHAQKLESVGRLAAGLAHEINTPCQFISSNGSFLEGGFNDLVGLIGVYERLRKEVSGQSALASLLAELSEAEITADLDFLRERVPGALADIGKGIHRIAKLVAAMKEFAQPGQHEAGLIDVNLGLVSTLTVTHHQMEGVADVVTRLGDIPLVNGYAGDLNQAFLHIVLNAIQAAEDRKQQTGARGRIEIETTVGSDGVSVAISDTGPGIPEEIRSQIFDPFFTTREVGRGVGQGLTIARSIVVDKHRGTLTFDSRVGEGTTFYVRLPLVPSSESFCVVPPQVYLSASD
jgi:PAS domain S-box-containing protein